MRIARDRIAEREVREPSMPRSGGMAVLLVVGVLGLAATAGWATR